MWFNELKLFVMRLIICTLSLFFCCMAILPAQERERAERAEDRNLEKLKKVAIQATEEGDYRNAIKLLDNVIALDPEDFSLLGYRGICYFWTAKPKLAMSDLNTAIEHAPSDQFLFARFAARPYEDIKGKDADLTEAIVLNPEEARYYYERGKLKVRVLSEYSMTKDPAEVVTISSLNKKFEISFDEVCEDFKRAGSFNEEYAGKTEHYCSVFKEAFNQ